MSGLVLASQSGARRSLLRGAGLAFDCEAASVDEGALKRGLQAEGADPREVAEALATAKSLEVSARREGLVIGADQTLDLDGRLFDKPSSREEARRHLLAFRGRTHVLHSAATLSRGGQVVWAGVESVALAVRAFSDGFLDSYLEAEGEAIFGCVGAYRLEGLGAQLFERIEGDYFTVLGLPLLPLLHALRAEGVLCP